MTDEEAKKILALYRPGTADRTDPSFKEALDRTIPNPPPAAANGQAAPDPELGRWYLRHRSSFLSIRAKFQNIPVPADLKERILAEQPVQSAKIIPFRPMVILQAAAVVALCLGLAVLFLRPHAREDDFNTYRTRMARTAMQPYGMEIQGGDLQSTKTYLAGRQAPADYVLPDGVMKAQFVGCAVTHWQGAPVSMLCFHSGQPLPPGEKTDLWLFVIDQGAVHDSPAAASPIVAPVTKLMTATWARDGKLYVLAAAGDEAFLRKFL